MNGLNVENLRVTLGGNKILDGVTFGVEPGQVVGLIGANGAGKSTVLKTILGIVKPDDGHVLLGLENIMSLAPKERAKRLSYVPQGTPIHWPLTAERLVALGRTPHQTPWQEIDEMDAKVIRTAMEETDCWHLRSRQATTLSGGEKARVLLARTMAVGAPFMLADEPTASLDPLHQLQVMDIMRGQAQCGAGVLVVMHDLGFAQRFCDRLILLSKGRVIAAGEAEDVLTDHNLEAAFGVKVSRWSEGTDRFLAPYHACVD